MGKSKYPVLKRILTTWTHRPPRTADIGAGPGLGKGLLITRRECLAGLAVACLVSSEGSAEQAYPTGRTIKVIVPFAPGGPTDVVGRLVADRLTALWGVPVIVENVAGASSNVGNDRVAKGPADGTQLLIMAFPIITNQFLYTRLNYDPERDFRP